MRILLVGNYEPDAQQSMQRYARWLERVLLMRGYQVTVARPQPFFSKLAMRAGWAKYLGYLDKFLLFPRRLRRISSSYDVIHVLDHSNSMYLRHVRRMPCLITCHDVLAIRSARGEFPGTVTGCSGKLLQRWILAGLRSAQNVLCVSHETANDLRALIGETGAEVRVVHSSVNWDYRPNVPLQSCLISRLRLNPQRPYMLHVGGNHWYKNRMGVLRIFVELMAMKEFSKVMLVMVGQPMTSAMRRLIQTELLGDRVIEALDISNEELEALYGNALALLFPSIREGFGWPILEAQACGCPVITTCRPPMSEIAGEAAVLIDPADPRAAAAEIAVGINRREWFREAGFRNLTRFNENAVADQYCAFYEWIWGSAASRRHSEQIG